MFLPAGARRTRAERSSRRGARGVETRPCAAVQVHEGRAREVGGRQGRGGGRRPANAQGTGAATWPPRRRDADERRRVGARRQSAEGGRAAGAMRRRAATITCESPPRFAPAGASKRAEPGPRRGVGLVLMGGVRHSGRCRQGSRTCKQPVYQNDPYELLHFRRQATFVVVS